MHTCIHTLTCLITAPITVYVRGLLGSSENAFILTAFPVSDDRLAVMGHCTTMEGNAKDHEWVWAGTSSSGTISTPLRDAYVASSLNPCLL